MGQTLFVRTSILFCHGIKSICSNVLFFVSLEKPTPTSRMDQSSLLSLLGAELKKMELSSTMIFLLTDRKMLLSSSKPIMIATRGMPGIPLNRESESVEDVHRVLRALP